MKALLLASLLLLQMSLSAQSLAEMLESDILPAGNPTLSAFRSTHLVNGHTTEKMPARELDFRVSHRFGALNGGLYDFFGLDYAQTHLSLEYGLNDRIMAGIGRSTYEKTADAFAKFALLKQGQGDWNSPLHLNLLLSGEVFGLRPLDGLERSLTSRITWVQQLLIARSFSRQFSMQLMPSHIYRNQPPSPSESKSLAAMGIGASASVSPRVAFNLEYYYVVRPETFYLGQRYRNPLSLGLDIQTGGHVFQLLLSNARTMKEGSFIGRTTGSWLDGDIHFGFNISRVFSFN